MAKVRITRREAEQGLLPPVCALTGESTEDVKRKTFLWQPGWISVLILAGLLPYLIVAMLLRKSMTVNLPLVRAKHGHWAWRMAVGLLLILGSLGAFFGGVAMNMQRDTETVGGYLMLGGLAGFVLSLIVVAVLNQLGIRPTEITDNDITLAGVHQNFVDALEDDRERDEEEYQRRRQEERGRRPSRDDDRPRRAFKSDDEDDRPRRARRDDYDD